MRYATAQQRPSIRSLTVPVLTGAAVFAAAVVVFFLAVPLLTVLLRTAESISEIDSDTRDIMRQAMRLTLATTAVSLFLTILLGSPLAFILARRRFRGARVVDTLVDLPIVLPPAVAGLALLLTFGRRGLLGESLDAAGITISFSTAAVVMAQCFVAAPFYIRSAKAGFTAVYRDSEEAAAVDGADRWRVFRDITLPLALPALSAGTVLAWARAVGEFGATILFAGNFPGRTQTVPLAIYGRYEAGDMTTALVLSSVLLAVSMGILFVLRMVFRSAEHPVQ
jgi:molybdate transport system permease protein